MLLHLESNSASDSVELPPIHLTAGATCLAGARGAWGGIGDQVGRWAGGQLSRRKGDQMIIKEGIKFLAIGFHVIRSQEIMCPCGQVVRWWSGGQVVSSP